MGKTILFVLLTLLKILGILLLAGLLLILLILFVAVRYRLCVRLEERRLEGCVAWLGFVVRVPFRVEKGDVSWRIRLLGIPVMGSRRKKKQTDSGKSKKGRKKVTEKKTREEHAQEEASQSPAGKESGVKHEEKVSLFPRFFALLHEIIEKLQDGIEQVVTWIKTFVKTLHMLKKKVHSVKELIEILRTEHGRAFICIAKENVIHLLGQLRPQVIKGDIIFGLGDPCTTGEALGVLSILYGWIGTGVKVTPDFMEKRLEGYIKMRGRIRMITLIRIALRIIWNKEGRKLQSELQKWKEDF